jgi:hypothetical protein
MMILPAADDTIRLLEELNGTLHLSQSLPLTLELILSVYSEHVAADIVAVILVNDEEVSQILSTGDSLAVLEYPFLAEDIPCWPALAQGNAMLLSADQDAEGRGRLAQLRTYHNQLYLPVGKEDALSAIVFVGRSQPFSESDIRSARILSLQIGSAIQQIRQIRYAKFQAFAEYYDWLRMSLHNTVDQSLTSAASLTGLISRLIVENPGDASTYLNDVEELLGIAILDMQKIVSEVRERLMIFGDEANDESTKDTRAAG